MSALFMTPCAMVSCKDSLYLSFLIRLKMLSGFPSNWCRLKPDTIQRMKPAVRPSQHGQTYQMEKDREIHTFESQKEISMLVLTSDD